VHLDRRYHLRLTTEVVQTSRWRLNHVDLRVATVQGYSRSAVRHEVCMSTAKPTQQPTQEDKGLVRTGLRLEMERIAERAAACMAEQAGAPFPVFGDHSLIRDSLAAAKTRLSESSHACISIVCAQVHG